MARAVKVDFTGVESFLRASEGEHVCKIAAADIKQSQGGNDMIVVQFEVTKGADKGARVFENYPLVETALWKLKGLLQAIGMRADGKVQLDLDRLVGKICVVEVFHEEYEGKVRAKVDSVKRYSAESAEDETDEDEEEAEEEKPKKVEKPKATQKKAPAPVEEDDDEDWEEDEEEEEKPAPKKAKATKPEKKPEAKKPAKKSSDEEDDWSDDDWDE